MKKIIYSFLQYFFSLALLVGICWALLQLLPGNVHLDEYQTIQIEHQDNYLRSWVDPSLNVFQAIQRGLSTTFKLGILSLLCSYSLAFLMLWFVQSSKQLVKNMIMQSTMIFISLPILFLAPVLIYYFSFYLNLLPAGELNNWTSYLLPVLVLMIRPTVHLFRLLRSQYLEIKTEQFVVVAQAKGLTKKKIFLRHLLPHLMIPVITYSPQMIISIVSGSFVVETLFAIPGAGFYLVKAMETRDYPVILAYVLLWGGLLLLLSRLAEILIHFIDPRRLREVH